MDQKTLLTPNVDGGSRFVEALRNKGFPIEVAFWAKLVDKERWVLFIATPDVGTRGIEQVYDYLLQVTKNAPQWGIDLFEVTAIRDDHPMARAALDYVTTMGKHSPHPNGGHTFSWYAGSLGGVEVDAALIYPNPRPAVPTSP